jgi:hypothetical protein
MNIMAFTYRDSVTLAFLAALSGQIHAGEPQAPSSTSDSSAPPIVKGGGFDRLAPTLRRVLTENGIAVKPETVMSGSRAKRSDALSAPYKMSSTPPADMLIDGLIVRFAAEDAKARARANQTPPDGLLAQFYAVANTPMIFQRAMSMDAFVFRFMTPLKWEDTINSSSDCVRCRKSNA